MPPGVFDRYPASAADEAVGAQGRLVGGYAALGPAVEQLGAAGLAAAATELDAERSRRGVVFTAVVDGQAREQPFPLDPLPRVVPADEWAHLSLGVEQRLRTVNAFLADVYRADGEAPEIVRAGVLPDGVIARCPGYRPGAAELAWPGQPRATVSGLDLLRGGDGGWVVLEDNLRVPSGIGYALANRESIRTALPELFAGDIRPADPWPAVGLLRHALLDAAPPGSGGAPQLAVLSDGAGNTAWFEHQLLGAALGVPVGGPETLWPRPDGGVAVAVDGERVPVDVLYRRFDEDDLPAHASPAGMALDVLLGDAVRAGKLALANVPGNGLADDKATYCHVPAMIEFYLGEKAVLAQVPTWVLADKGDYAAVRDRLHELVVKPVDGYGGQGVVFGSTCSAGELEQLRAEVAAAPERFVAQEPVYFSTAPTVIGDAVAPRHVDLRVFAVAGADTRALPAPLTRVALAEGSLVVNSSRGGGSKDTWLLT